LQLKSNDENHMDAPPAARRLEARRRAHTVATGMLVLVGVAPISSALVHPRWGFVSTMTGASPLPLVFDALPGYEPWACRYELAIAYADGARERIELTPNVLARMPGPHWPHLIHAVYALPFALSPVLDRALWAPPLRATLCRESPFLGALGARAPARTVTIEITTKASAGRRSWRIPFRC
jgi:hypothetical protein